MPNAHWKLTLPPLDPSGGGIVMLDTKTAPAHARWDRLLTVRVLGAVTESPYYFLPKSVGCFSSGIGTMLLCGSRFKASGLRLPKVSDRKKTSKVGGLRPGFGLGPFYCPEPSRRGEI